MSVAAEAPARPAADRRIQARRLTLWLALLLVATSVLSLGAGASDTSLWRVLGEMAAGREIAPVDRIVLWDIRLPRLAEGILVGAALAVSGAILQGLFRNPLADPGIIGISAGASLAAISAIVLGGLLPVALQQAAGSQLVALSAFLGALGATVLLYRMSTRHGQTSVATMLLAGIALTALGGALSGILIYMADDSQLRDLTFWNMGSLAGATWNKVLSAAPLIVLALVAAPFLARGLNGLALGEAAAAHIGVPVQRLKRVAILAVAGATGTAVAVSGGIGFVGIVVPHLLRLATGPDHRTLLPNAALLGATLLLAADMIARTIVAPAELPIGIVTAIIGAPFFLWILLRQRHVIGF
ncbi:FecCD family ABC transporter permease [Tropicimonas sp.]|uniref:FecCD family ABC transporter permease n=1 Tax=Tropicimonas sp. TaxID=2067044 RepID=UPI003A8A5504